MRQLVFFIVLAIALGIKCTKENVLTTSVENAALASHATVAPPGKIMVVKCDTTYIDDTTVVDPEPEPEPIPVPEPEPEEKNIVFFGSSTIVQWNLGQAFPDKKIKKVGYGGKTWTQLTALVDTISKLNAKQVVIYSGDNDIIARRSVAQMTVDVQKLINRIWTLVPDAHVTFLYTKPSDTAFKITLSDKVTTGIMGIEYTNRNIANWSKNSHSHHLNVVDTYSPFLLWNPKRLSEKHYQADKLHLNQSTGYPVLNKLVGPLLK